MTPDELRALAGKLRKLQAGEAYEAADYLRACAEAEPVAWQFKIGVCVGENLFQERDHVSREWREGAVPLYLHPAPAVPQAEPKLTPASGDDLNVYKEMADNYRNDAQAEPKREPTCLWSRADDDTDVWETSCGHAFTIIEGTPSDNHMEFCCYCGRRVDEEIGGSDE